MDDFLGTAIQYAEQQIKKLEEEHAAEQERVVQELISSGFLDSDYEDSDTLDSDTEIKNNCEADENQHDEVEPARPINNAVVLHADRDEDDFKENMEDEPTSHLLWSELKHAVLVLFAIAMAHFAHQEQVPDPEMTLHHYRYRISHVECAVLSECPEDSEQPEQMQERWSIDLMALHPQPLGVTIARSDLCAAAPAPETDAARAVLQFVPLHRIASIQINVRRETASEPVGAHFERRVLSIGAMLSLFGITFALSNLAGLDDAVLAAVSG